MAKRAADPTSESLDVMVESPRGATVKFKHDLASTLDLPLRVRGEIEAPEASKKARSRRRTRR